MSLYNFRSTQSPSAFTCNKFDEDLNPLGYYVVTIVNMHGNTMADVPMTCVCPAGPRPTCRHRQMLPAFIETGRVDSGWFFDPDSGIWHEPIADNLNMVEEGVGLPQSLPTSLPTWRRNL